MNWKYLKVIKDIKSKMILKNKKLLKELNSYPFYKVIRSKQKTNSMLKKKISFVCKESWFPKVAKYKKT